MQLKQVAWGINFLYNVFGGTAKYGSGWSSAEGLHPSVQNLARGILQGGGDNYVR